MMRQSHYVTIQSFIQKMFSHFGRSSRSIEKINFSPPDVEDDEIVPSGEMKLKTGKSG